MKCPFRTTKRIKTTYQDNPFNAGYGKIKETTFETQFEECSGDECPYYGIKMFDPLSGGTYTEPGCRRVE